MEQLPDDMVGNVLGRLPPSSLAASRCVRKRWCSIIDGRGLLRADLLPLRLDAFYCISLDLIERRTYLFARPAPAARRIPGGPLDFFEDYHLLRVVDHCNGLLLVCDDMMVVNPATRQWATLPDCPEPSIHHMLGVTVTVDQDNTIPAETLVLHDEMLGITLTIDDQEMSGGGDDLLYPRFYLVYDPMAESSPQHFEVFLIPILGRDLVGGNTCSIDLAEQEWPPSTLRTHVFSSRRWRWEERSWIQQGEPAGTMADMLHSEDCCGRDYKAVYFRGALYVHCQNDSVIRIALSNDNNNKYQTVRSLPAQSKLGTKEATFFLGKSEKGVYSALLYWVDYGSCPQFRVWLLKEEEEEEINDGNHIIHMEWVLKTSISLEPLLAKPPPLHKNFDDDEWRVIRNYNKEEYNEEELEGPAAAAAVADDDDDEFAAADDDEWDFDNAGQVVLEANKDSEAVSTYPVDFLGFHPYKEIVFFSLSSRTVSYNLNTSKVQKLGSGVHLPVGLRTCFPYTPSWMNMGELFENN